MRKFESVESSGGRKMRKFESVESSGGRKTRKFESVESNWGWDAQKLTQLVTKLQKCNSETYSSIFT